MFFEDLSPYRYHGPPTGLPGVLSVGWLSRFAPYNRGRCNDRIIHELADLSREPVLLKLGTHECELCLVDDATGSDSFVNVARGNGEIWVKSADGVIYAAPTLVHHYVKVHSYCPPDVFVDALESGYSVLTEGDCRSLIEEQDILVPYYNASVCWPRSLFRDLDAFRGFLSSLSPVFLAGEGWHDLCTIFSMNDDSFMTHITTRDPTKLLQRLAEDCGSADLMPYKCIYKQPFSGTRQECYLKDL